MTLLECKVQKVYKIEQLQIEGNTGRRLLSLGLIHGTPIQVINRKRNGAVIFKARGSRFAIGSNIAANIFVNDEIEDKKEVQ